MISKMKLARLFGEALALPTFERSDARVDVILSEHRLGIMRLLTDSDYPETQTVRVNVTERDKAAYKLACLAWPGEAEDHRQRWYRRIVFEPDQLTSVANKALQNAMSVGLSSDEITALIRIVVNPEPGSPTSLMQP